MKVKNMKSSNGNTIPNQFIVTDETTTYFQSYDSIIVKQEYGKPLVFDEHYWDYSATTGKYRNQFVGFNIAEARKKIKSGEIILANLN